jgi:heme-degrading monooxygenase HmoA
MFAHNVTLRLKPNSAPEFSRILQNRVIPLLQERNGFLDEITLTSSERLEALVISFWDTRESAEAYDRIRYVEFLRALLSVIEGIPKVELFQVTNLTLRKTAAKVA